MQQAGRDGGGGGASGSSSGGGQTIEGAPPAGEAAPPQQGPEGGPAVEGEAGKGLPPPEQGEGPQLGSVFAAELAAIMQHYRESAVTPTGPGAACWTLGCQQQPQAAAEFPGAASSIGLAGSPMGEGCL